MYSVERVHSSSMINLCVPENSSGTHFFIVFNINPVWVRKWVKVFGALSLGRKGYKSTVFRKKDGAFLVAGVGLEPTTSGL